MTRLIQVDDRVADAWSTIPEELRRLITGPVLQALAVHAAAAQAQCLAAAAAADADPADADVDLARSASSLAFSRSLDALEEHLTEAVLSIHSGLAERLGIADDNEEETHATH